MAALAPIALGIGAAASVVGTVGAISAGNRAANAQRQQQTLQRRRSIRQNIRAAQIQRAASLASAGGAGVSDSSGLAGGIRSISSRAGEAIGFAGQQSALSGIVSRANQRAANFSGLASIGGSLINFGQELGGSFRDVGRGLGLEPRQAAVPDFTGPVGGR